MIKILLILLNINLIIVGATQNCITECPPITRPKIEQKWALLFFIRATNTTEHLLQEKLSQIKSGANKHCDIFIAVETVEKENRLKFLSRLVENYKVQDNELIYKDSYISSSDTLESLNKSLEFFENNHINHKTCLIIIDLENINYNKDCGSNCALEIPKVQSIGIFNQYDKNLRITDKNLKYSLEDLRKKIKKKLDLLILDIDLSANIEMAHALNSCSKWLIAFQQRYNSEFINYENILNILKQENIKPLKFSKEILKSFDISLLSPNQKLSVSLINLSLVNLDMRDSFNKVWASLSSFITNANKNNEFLYAVTHSRKLSTKFGNKNFCDLIYLSSNLENLLREIKHSNYDTINYLCDKNRELINKLKNIVIENKANIHNCSGISIYYPNPGKQSYDYGSSYWAQSSWWANFLIHLRQNFKRNKEGI